MTGPNASVSAAVAALPPAGLWAPSSTHSGWRLHDLQAARAGAGRRRPRPPPPRQGAPKKASTAARATAALSPWWARAPAGRRRRTSPAGVNRSTSRPSWASRLARQPNCAPRSHVSAAPAASKIPASSGLVSPSTSVDPGFTMPAFSVAMSVRSGADGLDVVQAHVGDHRHLAVGDVGGVPRPPRPTSTTATSTATSANHRKAAAVRISK